MTNAPAGIVYNPATGNWSLAVGDIVVGDIATIYTKVGSTFDRERAIELARSVYPGAEREFRALLDKIDRDEPIAI